MKENKSKNTDIKEIISSALKIVLVLLIIFCIASTFYKTRSVRLLIILLIGIPVVLIFARYVKLFFGTSENYTSADIGYKSQYTDSRFEAVTSVLKKLWRLIILLGISSFIYILPYIGRHPPVDERHVSLDYSDAPESTAYIDLLVKKDEIGDDMYTDFNAPPVRPLDESDLGSTDNYFEDLESDNGALAGYFQDLNIDSSSDIAGYNDDGYVSLSVHSKEVNRILTEKIQGYSSDSLLLNTSAEDICDKYSGIKLAYVNEDGKVLDVTKTEKHSYDITNCAAFTANGEEAEFRTTELSPLGKLASFLLLLNVLIIIIVIPVLIIVRINDDIRWKSWVSEEARKASDSKDDAKILK